MAVLWAIPARAQDPLLTYEFGLALQTEGEHYRAITEFKRTLFLTRNTQSPLRELAAFNIGRSFLLGADYQQAARELENFVLSYPSSTLVYRAQLLRGRALIEADDFEVAEDTLLVALQGTPDSLAGVRLSLREEIAWGQVYRFKWPEAEASLQRAALIDPNDPRISGMLERVTRSSELRRKSPALAGALSAVLPGAGQAYVGNWGDGAVALLVNGLFIWGAVAAYEEDMPEVAGLIGFIELGWYGGNIFGAVNAARRFNRGERQGFVDSLEQDFRLLPSDL